MAHEKSQIESEFMSEFKKKSSELPKDCYVSPIEYKMNTQDQPAGTMFMESIPVGTDIKPENISISLKGRIVTVCVKKEGDGVTSTGAEYGRMFTLPRNVDLNELASAMTEDGNLNITAPYIQQ